MPKGKKLTKFNDTLNMSKMLEELPIKEQQVRAYIRTGRLKAKKIRNRFFVTRQNFDDFKLALGF